MLERLHLLALTSAFGFSFTFDFLSEGDKVAVTRRKLYDKITNFHQIFIIFAGILSWNVNRKNHSDFTVSRMECSSGIFK